MKMKIKIDSAEPENNSMTQQTVDAQQVVIPQESERIQRAEVDSRAGETAA